MKTHKHSITILLFFFFCCIPAISSESEDPNSIEGTADIIAQVFIWEIADIPALCKDLKITPAELKMAIKTEFLKLVPKDRQEYREYLTNNQSEDEQIAIVMDYLHEYSLKSPSLDFESSFLVYKIFQTRSDKVTENEDGTKNRQMLEEDSINVVNFCMNALDSSVKRQELPAVFQKAKIQMPANYWDYVLWLKYYHIASKMKDYKTAWWWVNSSILLLHDAAKTTNHELDYFCSILGFLYTSTLSKNDERYEYYQLQIAVNSKNLLATLDKSILKQVNSKYPALDWKSPTSFGLYWCEYAQSKLSQTSTRLEKQLFYCIRDSCFKGHVNLIGNHEKPQCIFKTPNFELFSIYYERMYRAFKSSGMKKEMADRSIKYCTKQLFLYCYKFNKNDYGKELFSRLKEWFPDDTSLNNSYSYYMHQLYIDHVSQMDINDINVEIYTSLWYGYSLIAIGKTEDGDSLFRYSGLVFMDALSRDMFKKQEFAILQEKVLQKLFESLSESQQSNLKIWQKEYLERKWKKLLKNNSPND